MNLNFIFMHFCLHVMSYLLLRMHAGNFKNVEDKQLNIPKRKKLVKVCPYLDQ